MLSDATGGALELLIGNQTRGDRTPQSVWNGTVDEFRVSLGARYVSDFTPEVHLKPDLSTKILLLFNEGAGFTSNSISVGGPNARLIQSAQWLKVSR
jgi:hypothetical protein